MSRLTVAPGGAVRGQLRVPGDKSISHRALLLGALARGTSTVRGLSTGDDVARTRQAVAALGVEVVDHPPDGAGGAGGRWLTTAVSSGGPGALREPGDVLDVGNSGTTLRLLCGVAASLPFLTVLTGDASLRRRPVDRVAEPLRAMGARVDGRDGGRLPPVAVRGGGLRGGELTVAVPSAQVKSAIILAALGADGPTVVHQPVPTRAHTEELLVRAGAQVTVADGGRTVTVRPGPVAPLDLTVPGDPSQAAFWLVAAALAPESDVVVEDVYAGPARRGFLEVLARMGALVEPVEGGGLRSRHVGRLRATDVAAEEVPGLVDEIPVLAVAAAAAEGTSRFAGLGELRLKESDRVAAVAAALRTLGVGCEVHGDDLVVAGGRLGGGTVQAGHDHRMAMAMAVAGVVAAEPVTIEGWESVATSYPGFERQLDACRS